MAEALSYLLYLKRCPTNPNLACFIWRLFFMPLENSLLKPILTKCGYPPPMATYSLLSSMSGFPTKQRLNLPCKNKDHEQFNNSGGGTCGRMTAFCLGRPGLNPGTDLGFFKFRIAVIPISLGVRLFLITCNRTVRTLYSFLFLS